jgi:hypothetical protein
MFPLKNPRTLVEPVVLFVKYSLHCCDNLASDCNASCIIGDP